MRVFGLASLFLYSTLLFGQRGVLPSQRHERMLVVVPMIGVGRAADPKRPMFTGTRGVAGNAFLFYNNVGGSVGSGSAASGTFNSACGTLP
ncbi:MAG: hypothetical protein SFV54_13495 [Bryobacteraceae bacterium]|nr:hypothetical protein [Bryobacteraceae bacterium]